MQFAEPRTGGTVDRLAAIVAIAVSADALDHRRSRPLGLFVGMGCCVDTEGGAPPAGVGDGIRQQLLVDAGPTGSTPATVFVDPVTGIRVVGYPLNDPALPSAVWPAWLPRSYDGGGLTIHFRLFQTGVLAGRAAMLASVSRRDDGDTFSPPAFGAEFTDGVTMPPVAQELEPGLIVIPNADLNGAIAGSTILVRIRRDSAAPGDNFLGAPIMPAGIVMRWG